MFFPSDDNPTQTTQHCRESFGALIDIIFNSNMIAVKEFWESIKNKETDLATIWFQNIWNRIIMPKLIESKIYILHEEVTHFFRIYFSDKNNLPQKNDEIKQLGVDYTEIWLTALSGPYETADFETLSHLRQDLEMEEDWHKNDLEGKAKIKRQDMLQKIVRLAFLATSRLADSPYLQDRLKASFAKDLNRLMTRFLPDSRIKCSSAELKQIISKQLPVIKQKPQLLELVNKYANEEIALVSAKAEEPGAHDLIEQVVEAELETVSVKEITIDSASHEPVVTEEEIPITTKGILTAINKIEFNEGQENNYRHDLLNLFHKILEQVANRGGITALGGLTLLVFDVRQKLASRLEGKDPTTWGKNEKKCHEMIVALGLFDTKISELKPMTFRTKDTCFYYGDGN
jgi:hypothetical protein